MSEKVIIIKHSTGNYNLHVEPDKISDMRGQIDKCLNNQQPAIVVVTSKGDQHIYPADFLKNSYIQIIDEPAITIL